MDVAHKTFSLLELISFYKGASLSITEDGQVIQGVEGRIPTFMIGPGEELRDDHPGVLHAELDYRFPFLKTLDMQPLYAALAEIPPVHYQGGLSAEKRQEETERRRESILRKKALIDAWLAEKEIEYGTSFEISELPRDEFPRVPAPSMEVMMERLGPMFSGLFHDAVSFEEGPEAIRQGKIRFAMVPLAQAISTALEAIDREALVGRLAERGATPELVEKLREDLSKTAGITKLNHGNERSIRDTDVMRVYGATLHTIETAQQFAHTPDWQMLEDLRDALRDAIAKHESLTKKER